ncbi:MAG: alpha/beta hydrolase [Chloroflexi bacterium]|nr:alpha/beta hydrolase [Chloroflexota bacterium]
MAHLVQPVEGELKLNGLRINYFEWKGRGRRPLVLMHGLRDYAYFWQDCANRLLDDFHVYSFDQRGHGESANRVEQARALSRQRRGGAHAFNSRQIRRSSATIRRASSSFS